MRGFVRILNHKRKKWRQKSKERKPHCAQVLFGLAAAYLARRFSVLIWKQQQKELFLRPTRGARVDTKHTHTRNCVSCVCVIQLVSFGCAFSLIPVVCTRRIFSHLKFQPEKNCLKMAPLIRSRRYYIIDETKLFSQINWSTTRTRKARMGRRRREMMTREIQNEKEFRNKVKGYCLSHVRVSLELFWWGWN